MNKAVFLDKDGTLINDVPYNINPDVISLMPNAAAGVKLLQDSGYIPVIVSNQSGIALGYFSEADLIGVTAKIRSLLGEEGVEVHGFYYCPHAAEGIIEPYAHACSCRKPFPGMLLAAARHFALSLTDSWMIGDILDDIEAGKRAGCRTILINNGHETEWRMDGHRRPDYMTADLKEAAGIIIDAQASPGKEVSENIAENVSDGHL
jgi:D-glycero-D-manno-heptose 1,7-bisphosphate phosphatase